MVYRSATSGGAYGTEHATELMDSRLASMAANAHECCISRHGIHRNNLNDNALILLHPDQ
ncbi:MAG: hypothetical protein ACXACT_17970 [Candidatus Thorarchaeota archaeon]